MKLLLIILYTSSWLNYSYSKTCQENKLHKVNLEKIHNIASELFISETNYIFNMDSTAVICTGKTSRLDANISFFVYSFAKKEIVLEEFRKIEYVKWKNNKTVKYKVMPRVIKKGDSKVYYTYFNL